MNSLLNFNEKTWLKDTFFPPEKGAWAGGVLSLARGAEARGAERTAPHAPTRTVRTLGRLSLSRVIKLKR